MKSVSWPNCVNLWNSEKEQRQESRGVAVKKRFDFSAKAVYFMTITVGSPMDVSLKMNAKKSGFSPLLWVQYLVEVVYEAN